MSNIINQIIEIDSIAQKRLDDANKYKEQIKLLILQKAEQTNEFINSKVTARVEKILEIENQYAQQEKDRITSETDEIIQRLEQSYSDNHLLLERTIFQNITGCKQ